MTPRLGTGFRTVVASWSSAEVACPSCLPAMGSVISINSRRPAVDAEVASPTGSARFGVSDVISAVDPKTRKLLGRGRLERRAWLVPRGLLLADLIGLSMAYVLTTLSWGEAGAFGSFSRDPRVSVHPSVLGHRGQAPGVVQQRPGAGGSFDRRRRRRRVPSGDDRDLGVAGRITGGWPSQPERVRADHVLGFGDLHPSDLPHRGTPCLQAQPSLRAEHPDRGRRRDRPADRSQARQASGVRHQRGRVHRPGSEDQAGRPA